VWVIISSDRDAELDFKWFGEGCEGEESWHDLGMPRPRKVRRLADAYTFPGVRPLARVFGYSATAARLVTLVRRGKKRSVGAAASFTAAGTTAVAAAYGICPAVVTAFTWTSRSGASTVGAVV